jgi:hypothetical protein
VHFGPLTRRLPITFGAGGCIDLREFAKSRRCRLVEISDQIDGKLQSIGQSASVS